MASAVKILPETYPSRLADLPYAHEHRLQTLDIYLPRPLASSNSSDTIWIVFIHGGAWRDPHQMSAELLPAWNILLSRRGTLSRIAGLASINYGLSTNVSQIAPTDGGIDSGKQIRHPGHIQDVLTALTWLKRNYAVSQEGGLRYVLAGHSCGATLALQAIMGRWHGQSSTEGEEVTAPIAVVGLEGLYDLPLLVQNHIQDPVYRDFVCDAFGDDENVWRDASPVNGNYRQTWKNTGKDGSTESETRLVVLGHSLEDSLVEVDQVHAISKVFQASGWSLEKDDFDQQAVASGKSSGDAILLLKLRGEHDEIWSDGQELLKAIEVTIDRLFRGI